MSIDYQQQLSDRRQKKIRDILKYLPPSCTDFIRSIHTTTSALTRMAYATDLNIFYEYLFKELPYFQADSPAGITDDELGLLTPQDIDGYAEYLSLYYRQRDDEFMPMVNHEYGIMRKLSSLRSYFEYLYRMGRIQGNVASLVPLPKLHEKPILRLELEEMQALLSAAKSGEGLAGNQIKWHEKTTGLRDYAILMLFLGTGMRVSECVGINRDDLDLDEHAVLVTRKGGNQVILYYPQEVADALRDYAEKREEIVADKENEQAFFLSSQKKRISQRAVELMVKKYATLVVPLKKRISPHKLRSTYATNLYHETGDIYLVADALGHSNVNTTRKHYAAMTDERRRQAASHVHLSQDESGNE